MPLRNNRLMSEGLKYELAKELGVLETVQNEGWGSVPSKDCGNLVKLAIQKAQEELKRQGEA